MTAITDSQIATLRTEAAQYGDDAMAAICTAALAGDAAAREECASVIRDAADRAAND